MDSMIPILQILIFIIFLIMFALIGLYIYLLKPKAKKEQEMVSVNEALSMHAKGMIDTVPDDEKYKN